MAFPGGSAVRGAMLASWEVVLSWGKGVPACEELAITLVALVTWKISQVTFPSFLCNKLLNLFTCLLLTLLNLNSPTFSTKTLAFPTVGS